MFERTDRQDAPYQVQVQIIANGFSSVHANRITCHKETSYYHMTRDELDELLEILEKREAVPPSTEVINAFKV